MYKTAVYTLVNGAITHITLPKCQCTAEQYHIFIFAVFDVN